MINDDKTFYHKALVWSAFFVLGDKTTCYCLSSLRNISSPYFTLNRNFGAASRNKLLLHNSCKLNYYHPICSIIVVNRTFMSTLQPKTNRCNSDFSFIKKAYDPLRTILFERCTAQTLVMLYISTQYTNKCKTISPVKLFGASLNRSS